MSDLGLRWVRDYDEEHNRITYDLGGEVQRLARKVTQMVDAGAAELVIEHLEEHGLLAAHDEQVRAEERERIVTAEARDHWEWTEGRRAKFGDEGCVCTVCGLMARIARQGGSE